MSQMSATRNPTLVVVEGGPLTTVQDGGRPGLAHHGVPRSGALDRASGRLANRLVGNPADAAVLEATVSGPTLRLDDPGGPGRVVAVTGATAEVTVDGRLVGVDTAVLVAPGQELRVGSAREGIRLYVAVSGGIETDVVLGSRSADLLSGIGPPPLTAGDRLPVGPSFQPAPLLDVVPVRARPPVLELRILPGPRHDWLLTEGWELLTTAHWVVRSESNRVGLRLDGPTLPRTSGELPPEGLMTGALQIPNAGAPVLFLADHPTTGGYPVPAVVVDEDLDAAGQAGPGTVVVFRRLAWPGY
jgi:biotin-dependent carboxylase-like uncharacterized protein